MAGDDSDGRCVHRIRLAGNRVDEGHAQNADFMLAYRRSRPKLDRVVSVLVLPAFLDAKIITPATL
jgi:hypothetical protein